MPDNIDFHALAKTIRLFGVNLYGAVVATRGPSGDLFRRMKTPKVGDLVWEVTTARRCEDNDHINAVGYLLEQGVAGNEVWKEDFTRITTLDGREERWTNALFFALPDDKEIPEYRD